MHSAELTEKITSLLEQDKDVVFAYLFGSHAKGTAHPLSDVDVAVYCAHIHPGRDGDMQAVDKRIDLGLTLERTLRRRVDVVVLNRASIDMRQNVLAHGQLLVNKTPDMLAQFKREQLRAYQDFIMMARIFHRYRKKRIEEGAFGG